jgi:hypothetical protein
MKSAEQPPSPFVSMDTDEGAVLVRAARYGLALDFDGNSYLGDRHGSLLIGQRVIDFIDEPAVGKA